MLTLSTLDDKITNQASLSADRPLAVPRHRNSLWLRHRRSQLSRLQVQIQRRMPESELHFR